MDRIQFYEKLKNLLTDIIKSDYVLLDVPYFPNVGDVLIWQSALDILGTLPYKCLYSTSKDTYCKPDIDENVTIVFMGGGNFGDLWSTHHEFRHRVMKDFPRNPVVQLPQSFCFKKESSIDSDALFFARHNGPIHLLLRDEKSYNLAREKYKNTKVYLVPDLVLSFDVFKYIKSRKIMIFKKQERSLFVKRNDCEKKFNIDDAAIPSDVFVSDWPCMENVVWLQKIFVFVYRLLKFFLPTKKRYQIADLYYKYILRRVYLKNGILFISRFNIVYSTRLHSAILAWLMGKEVFLFDNSYGKCSGVYNKWLKNQPNIILMENKDNDKP